MATTYKLSTAARVMFGSVLIAVPAATVAGLFLVTDDGIVPHENSALVEQYANADLRGATAAEPREFSSTYGKPGGTETLVLYDAEATYAEAAEMYSIVAGNLATHFGMVEIKTLDEYAAGDLDDYDGAVYVGTDWETKVPDAFVDDVLEGDTEVLWVGENVEALAAAGSENDFVATYGWDPNTVETLESTEINQLFYDDKVLNRFDGQQSARTEAAPVARTVDIPKIVDEDRVDLVATGSSAEDGGTEEHPWVIRSGNLTHLVELPFHFIDRNELYLVYADLYYDMLAPETEGSQRAAVRLEDVNAESSPEQLRAIADYLHDEGVPFQVAVIPIMIDRTPDEEDFYGLSLLDSPDVVEALKYMQQRGGTLIQHGTSHQYGAAKNPYSGRSGDDYEFYGYGCSATELPPYEWEPCENSSWVRKKDPLPEDDVDAHRDRLDHGREIMIEAGLGEPKIFETPHYTASVNAYVAMAEEYDARYEQVEYYAGMLSGGEFTSENSYGQIFPYSVHDIYGSTVYPENLQNPTEKEQNNHPARPPKEIVARAEANLAVTESTASFYFHPFLEIEYLAEVVDGIKDLGYEFVPVTELD